MSLMPGMQSVINPKQYFGNKDELAKLTVSAGAVPDFLVRSPAYSPYVFGCRAQGLFGGPSFFEVIDADNCVCRWVQSLLWILNLT